MTHKHWLFLGASAAYALHFTACTSRFDSCIESRTCPSGGAPEAGASGASGASENSGSSGDTAGKAGAAGQAGEAGATGEAGGAQTCGVPGTACCIGGDDCVGGATCKDSVCSCSEKLHACGDGCVDLKADPKNCGQCGHDCLGGDCDLGKCQPIEVAASQASVDDLATDGTYLYWTGGDQTHAFVARRRVDGSDAVTIIAPTEARATSLAVAKNGVYWLGIDHVRVCETPDCKQGPSDFEPTVSSCFHILFSSSSLFWSCPTIYAQNNGSMWFSSISGGTPTHFQASSANPTDLTSDDENVYWLNASGFNEQATFNTDGVIWRRRNSDGATTALVTGLTAQLSKVAVGGGALYFTPNGDGIFRVPLPNGIVTPLKFADSKGVDQLAADEHDLYWTDYFNGVVLRCAHLADCPTPDVIAPGQVRAGALAQDSVSIYWGSGEAGDATIRRLAK